MTNNDDRSVPGEIRLFFEFKDGELRHFRALSMECQRVLIDRIWEAAAAAGNGGTHRNWSSVDVPVQPDGWPDIDECWIANKVGEAAKSLGLPRPTSGEPCMRYDAGAGHPRLRCEGDDGEPPTPPHSCEACLHALEHPLDVDGFRVSLTWEFRVKFGPLIERRTPEG